jgi:hypothetical protein
MDVTNRVAHEATLARAMGKVLRQQFAIVMAALGDSPSMEKLTPQLFVDMQAAFQATIRPILERVFLDHAEDLTHTFPRTKQAGLGVDWGLINEAAAAWASQYSFELVTGITETTRRTLQKQIAAFFTDERSLTDLRKTLEKLFGPVRAAMIAETEVTRAASAAESAYADELRKLGLEVTFEWQTVNDEIVRRCPVCWPRHETLQGDGWTELPPAHPRCRCWVNTVVLND